MSFTKTKDRLWGLYDRFAGWLAHRPKPVRRAGHWVFGGVLWVAYFKPGGTVRTTFTALAKLVHEEKPARLFGNFVRSFMRGMDRTEQIRHGFTDEVDAMLTIPEQAKLDALLETQGVLLVIPHTNASLSLGRGLAQRYPVTALVRASRNEQRAASVAELYDRIGCDYMNVRNENPGTVARKVLKALAEKRLIIGTVDRIQNAPPSETPVNGKTDMVRATAFGEPIGIAGWPARFAARGKNPILPVMVDQTDSGMSLIMGEPIIPTKDIVETTQKWVSGMEQLVRAYPDEWAFSLDKYWSRVLTTASKRS